MLTEIQFNHYLDRHNLSFEARDYLTRVRNQQASRMVGVHAKTNISSWFYSEKMGRTISTESYSVERAFVVINEYIQTQYITRIPLAILVSMLFLCSFIFFIAGLILDSIHYHHKISRKVKNIG